MNLDQLIFDLTSERDRIDAVIAALSGSSGGNRRGRPPGMSASFPKKRTMSKAARARIGAAKKAWWAKQKKSRT
jgi:hypothetical protein